MSVVPSLDAADALPNITSASLLGEKTFLDVQNYFQPQINGGFVLVAAYLVFFMHAGFCMVEVGCVRAKNAKNTVIMTLLDAAFASIGWWITGFAFAFGDPLSAGPMRVVVGPGNGFIGYQYFVLSGYPGDMWQYWLFQYAFATTATTIVSGAVAERCRFEAYIFYSLYMSMWVYPCVAHWAWSPHGWATAFLNWTTDANGVLVPNPTQSLLFTTGVYDFAGSGVVHLVGGTASFWAAMALGPRIGRFDGEGKPVDMPGHNTSFFILGVFILWFGWYGFNPGSQLGIVGYAYTYNDGAGKFLNATLGGNLNVTSRCAVNTTLGAAFGLFGAFFYKMILEFIHSRTLVWDVMVAGNGTLAGLAAITAGCSTVEPWGACVIGIIAGMVYVSAAWLILCIFKVDDPVEAIAIHGFGGMWGVVATGLFATEDYVLETYGQLADGSLRQYGWWVGGNGKLLGAQIVWVLVVIGWVSAMMAPFFFVFKVIGFLRVSADMERAGLDASHHGGSAYNLNDFGTGAAVPPPTKGGSGGGDLAKEVETLKSQFATLSAEIHNGNGKSVV